MHGSDIVVVVKTMLISGSSGSTSSNDDSRITAIMKSMETVTAVNGSYSRASSIGNND